jgi:hypothetical protein
MWNKIILFPGLGVRVGRRKTNAADEAEGAAEFVRSRLDTLLCSIRILN